MRRSATSSSWWDHSLHPSSSPPGAFHDYPTYDDRNNRYYYDRHHHLAFNRHCINSAAAAATIMDSQPPPPLDPISQILATMDEDAPGSTTMSVTEEALRNCMKEEQGDEERRQRAQVQLASPAQLQLFSLPHRQEFLQHHPFAFSHPLPNSHFLSPDPTYFPLYYNSHFPFGPTTTRKRAPPKRIRSTSPKKSKAPVLTSSLGSSLTESETNETAEKESAVDEEQTNMNRLKPIPEDDATTNTKSSMCESKASTKASPLCVKPKAKKPRKTYSKRVVGKPKPSSLSALRSLSKHEITKAVQLISIPPVYTPSFQLIPPTPTPTKDHQVVPILPRGRVISPWTEDVPLSRPKETDDDALLHLMREDDIWSLSSSASDRPSSAEAIVAEVPVAAGNTTSTTWNDDPEMVSFLCDALDL